MDYHLLLFDYRNMLKWYRGEGENMRLTTNRVNDLMSVLRNRLAKDANILQEAQDIRRKVLRFDSGRAVVVYYVRFLQEPSDHTKMGWTNKFDDARLWARFESGHIEGKYPWTEYVGNPDEYQRIITMAKRVNETLQWPIRDPECLALIERSSAPSTDPITGGSGTTPIVHGATTSGRITTDSPIGDHEMEFPVTPPPFLTVPSRSPQPPSVAPSVLPGDLPSDMTLASNPEDSNPADSTLSTLDHLSSSRIPVSIPGPNESAIISEATAVFSDPASAEKVLSFVEKRPRVLPAGLIMDAASDAIDLLDSSLRDEMEIDEPDVDASLSQSPRPVEPSIAMDGPCVEDVDLSMEPPGEIVIEDYEKRGVIITNLGELLAVRSEDLVGIVPRILVDMTNESKVTKTRLATQRLAEEYGGVVFQQDPPLPTKWSEGHSMHTLRQQFATVSPVKKLTLGRLDANDGDTTPIQSQIYHTSFHPLVSYPVKWKQAGSAPFDWDGLVVLKRTDDLQVVKDDPSSRTPFEQCWDIDARPSTSPPFVFSGDVLSRLPGIIRSHLESLPADLSVWNQLKAPPYCAGIGANLDEEHVLKLTDHPLKDALAYLPQALMMIALHHASLDDDVEDLDEDTFQTIQSTLNQAASGTLFPWGYGGHYRTFFGIHFEDAWMPSANLHVAGAPKIWLFIRKDDFKRLYHILSPVLSPCFTFHRSLFIHPSFLIRHNIRFTVARQTTGDMIIAGSTSAHQGWNEGRNLAVSANFLDMFSIDIIRRDVVNDEKAPWPCACNAVPVPSGARISGTFMDLPLHDYTHKNVSNVGSTIYEWIYRGLPYIRKSKDFLHTDTDKFALAWRYLHEIDGEHVDAMDE